MDKDDSKEAASLPRYQVIKEYSSPYTDPLMLHAGDSLHIVPKESEWPGWIWCLNSSGIGRWVPESYIRREGADQGILLRDYSPVELSVAVGDQLWAGREECGWFWCTNRQGQSGWVPAECVKLIPTA